MNKTKRSTLFHRCLLWLKGYTYSHNGMCPSCTEKNKTELTFCNHGVTAYYHKE